MSNIVRRKLKQPKKPLTKPFFKEGNSYSKGRPKGSRNVATLAMLAIGEQHSKDILETLVEQAKKGDVASAKIILDRICPLPKGRVVVLDKLPIKIRNMNDLDQGLDVVIEAMAKGDITATEALEISNVLEKKFNIAQANLTNQLLELEAKIVGDSNG
jgi:hypothetical protein